MCIYLQGKEDSGHSPGEPALGDPARTGGLDKMTVRHHFQPQSSNPHKKKEEKKNLRGDIPTINTYSPTSLGS